MLEEKAIGFPGCILTPPPDREPSSAAVLGSQQPRSQGDIHMPATLPVHSYALRAEDGSRSDYAGPLSVVVAVLKDTPGLGSSSKFFSTAQVKTRKSEPVSMMAQTTYWLFLKASPKQITAYDPPHF